MREIEIGRELIYFLRIWINKAMRDNNLFDNFNLGVAKVSPKRYLNPLDNAHS